MTHTPARPRPLVLLLVAATVAATVPARAQDPSLDPASASTPTIVPTTATAGFPDLSFDTRAYRCDDGTPVLATTVNSADGASGLFLSSGGGAPVALVSAVAASGARYATPADPALGVETTWHEKNGTATYSVGTGDLVGPTVRTCTERPTRLRPPATGVVQERFVSNQVEAITGVPAASGADAASGGAKPKLKFRRGRWAAPTRAPEPTPGVGSARLLVQTVTLVGDGTGTDTPPTPPGATPAALAFVTPHHDASVRASAGPTVALARVPGSHTVAPPVPLHVTAPISRGGRAVTDPWTYTSRTGGLPDPLKMGLQWHPTPTGGVLSSFDPRTQAATLLPGNPFIFVGDTQATSREVVPPGR